MALRRSSLSKKRSPATRVPHDSRLTAVFFLYRLLSDVQSVGFNDQRPAITG
jgi:hypothetical protein